MKKIIAFGAFCLALLVAPSAFASSITAVSLSADQVTPSADLYFTLHSQPNVRQNVNVNDPVELPEGWFVELSRNDNYPAGVWGIYRVLLPENNIESHGGNVYSFEAPPEAGYYRFRMQDPSGNFFASEVFRVEQRAYVSIEPPRAIPQGGIVRFSVFDSEGNPWNITQEENHKVDVYYFGNSGPVSYASLDGNRTARVSYEGNGEYTFPAGNVMSEYYLNVANDRNVVIDSLTYNVVRGEVVEEEEEDVPDVLDPYTDEGEYEDTEPTQEEYLDDGENVDEQEEESLEEEQEEENEQHEDEAEEEKEDESVSTNQERLEQEKENERESENTEDTVESESDVARMFECPLRIGQAYRSPNSRAVYFVTRPHKRDGSIDYSKTSCTKRAFANAFIYSTYFSSWNSVTVDAAIEIIPDDVLKFMPFGRLYDPQYGALVKAVTDPKVYLLLGNKKYWINSESVFRTLGYSFGWVEDVSEDLLNAYENGGEITNPNRHPNYTLVKSEDSARVYRLEPDPTDETRTIRRHISSQSVFNRLRYRLDRILLIDNLDQYEEGTPIE